MSARPLTFVSLPLLAAAVLALASPGALGAGDEEYRLGVGDSVRVTVFDQPDLLTEGEVTESGKLNMALVGEVAVAGMTTAGTVVATVPAGVAVETPLFLHAKPDAHGDSAEHLVFVREAVHHAPAVLRRDHPQHVHLSGARVHLHLGEVGCERKSNLVRRMRMARSYGHQHLAPVEPF